MLHKLDSTEAPSLIDSFSARTKQWIDWQLNQFFSLATLNSTSENDSTYRGGQRHWWESLAKHWLEKTDDEATDDIVLLFARDKVLHQSLLMIAKNPSVKLVSSRRKVNVGKQLEMDSICLRDLEQKPGHTLLKKAAAAPRILSLYRTHSYATLENSIFKYAINTLIEQAKHYWLTNCAFESSRKVQTVKKFQQLLEKIAFQTKHFDCLEHRPSLNVQPNNCLLYDRNYNLVWMTYQRLLLVERISQEALEFQDVLWQETGRQLFGAILSSLIPECRTLAKSCAYIKKDMHEGRWTEHNSFPGPFEWGRHLLSFIDIWDPSSETSEIKALKLLGADQMIVAHFLSNLPKQIAVWYHHEPFENCVDPGDVMRTYAKKLKLAACLSAKIVRGLIISSAPHGSPMIYLQEGSLIFFTLPPDFVLRLETISPLLQNIFTLFLEN